MVITTRAPEVKAARTHGAGPASSPTTTGTARRPAPSPAPRTSTSRATSAWWRTGRPAEAVELIRRDNPMPAVIGRICPRPCEQKCRRNLVEEPLNINGIKRFVADLEAAAGGMTPRPLPRTIGRKVAVVGAGPAGLSCRVVPLGEGRGGHASTKRWRRPAGCCATASPTTASPRGAGLGDRGHAQHGRHRCRTGVRLGKDVTLEKLRVGKRRGGPCHRRVEGPDASHPRRGSPRGAFGHRLPARRERRESR